MDSTTRTEGAPLDPFAGQRLGRYEVHSRLTVGGMSDVLLASHRGAAGFRRLVVLKQILPDIKGKEDFVRMFLNEARIMGLFSHPHIAQVYDLDAVDEELFIAMEFVPGATLIEIAQALHRAGERIPMPLTLMAARDTARALHYAHTFADPSGRALPLVHRDVNQRNIMVSFDGVTKLLDFGIAKAPTRTARTAVGTIKGSSGYLSPEQIAGETPDPRSDVFALGIVLHECLTGLRLFPGEMADAMRSTLATEIAPPSSKNAEVPAALDTVVMTALSRKREERQASALELAQDLEAAAPAAFWRPEDAAPFVRQLFRQRQEDFARLLREFSLVMDDVSDSQVRAIMERAHAASPDPAPDWIRTSDLIPIVSVPPPASAPSLTPMFPVLAVEPSPDTTVDVSPLPAAGAVADSPPEDLVPIAEQQTQPRLRLADIKPPEYPWEPEAPITLEQMVPEEFAPAAEKPSWWSGLLGKLGRP